MKKCLVAIAGFLLMLASPILFCSTTQHYTKAIQLQEQFFLELDGKNYELNLQNTNCSSIIRQNYVKMSLQEKRYVADKLLKSGFSKEQIVSYLFPNFQNELNIIDEKTKIDAIDAMVIASKNCKIDFKKEEIGTKIDKKMVSDAFFDNFDKNKLHKIYTTEVLPNVYLNDIKDKFENCGAFKTSFQSSIDSRKNNIRLASSAINGKLIKSGETFSFNQTTGIRDSKKGYQSAKIIIGGKYVDGFGGGVCQVSTTLYNAALLSGLEIVEVHNHSLPTSYVEPGFDAMVNMGSSDLKIKNTTSNDYIITASTENDICKIVIYGIKPDFKIKRRFEKYNIVQAQDEQISVESSEQTGGEPQRISWPVDGYNAKAFLDYYDGNVLVKTEQIRDCKYNPKNGVVSV